MLHGYGRLAGRPAATGGTGTAAGAGASCTRPAQPNPTRLRLAQRYRARPGLNQLLFLRTSLHGQTQP